MSHMGVENGSPFGVIEPEGTDRPPQSERFTVRKLKDDRYQINHPFHGPVIIGDQSVFPEEYTDAAAVVLLDTLPYLMDCRKLNRTERFATRPYAGEFAQLSHCVSLGIMGSEFGGGPLEVFDGLWNDATHLYDGHQGDDNYQGHGIEDLHDHTRPDFFRRSGVVNALLDKGVLRHNGHGYRLGNTRLYVGSLFDEDEATVRQTFMSNKHPSRPVDADRYQYSSEEKYNTDLFRHRHSKDPARVPRALADASLQNIQRMVVLDEGQGDQLVFDDQEIAERVAREYGEQNALHWCEAVQDLVNDNLNLAERYFFTCDDPFARDFQYFYPRDYLHTSATLMFERFDKVAENDPFMKWLLDFTEKIAKDQQAKMAEIIDNNREYRGPDPMDGITLHRLDEDKVDSSFRVEGQRLIVVLPKGKMRTVDPRVLISRRETRPLSVLRPNVKQDIIDLHRWIGNYEAVIELESEEHAQMVERGLRVVDEGWPKALRRFRMPSAEFRVNIREANEYVLRMGQLASAA